MTLAYQDLPGFPTLTVAGHAGQLIIGKLNDVPVIVLNGRKHFYETSDAYPLKTMIRAVKAAGVETLFLSNAAGSLRPSIKVSELMLITDHINFSGSNPLFGEPTDRRFVGLTEAYDAGMRAAIERAADATGTPLAKGVYMWFSGPSFETPAEIRMARTMGADAVGMSTVPEAILGRFFRLRVAAVSTITNFAAGMTGAEISHEETKALAPLGAAKLERILRRFFRDRGLR